MDFDSPWTDAFASEGYVIAPDAGIGRRMISELIEEIEEAEENQFSRRRGGSAYAIRNLLEVVSAVRWVSEFPVIRHCVETILGPRAVAVRGLLFNKTPEANWKVAWHQDLTIAVRKRKAVPGFGPWSVKAGVPHVQPPAAVLERMLTLRLHLDDCGPENGPLQVLPGSHLAGKLDAEDIQSWRNRTSAFTCILERGGFLLMRPLLLHASSAAQKPGHRRVIHLEFSADKLPGGLEWFTAA